MALDGAAVLAVGGVELDTEPRGACSPKMGGAPFQKVQQSSTRRWLVIPERDVLSAIAQYTRCSTVWMARRGGGEE